MKSIELIQQQKSNNHPLAVDMAKELKIHALDKSFPEELFAARAPNENALERQYRRLIYQPETLCLWNSAYSQLHRIFQGKNFKINFNEALEEGKFQKLFFMKTFPFSGNIFSFFKNEVLPIKMIDPNAVLCFWKENEALKSKIFQSKEIIYLSNIEFLARLSKNDYFYSSQGVVQYVKEIDKIMGKYEIQEFIQENNIFFAEKLRGILISKDENNFPIYKSHFYDAVPILNQVLVDSSTLQVCKAVHAFPQKVEYADPCQGEGCENGTVYNPNSGKHDIICAVCHGTGSRNKTSPMGVFQLKSPSRLSEGDTGIPFPGMAYVSPDAQILAFLRSEIEINSRKAFSFIGMELSSSKVSGKDTAIGKVIEREMMFSFLLQIGEQLFELIRTSIAAIGRLMFGNDFIFPEIKNNSQFRIWTDDEVLSQIANIKKETLPISIKKKYLLDLIPPTNEQKLIALADILFAEDEDMIIKKFQAGLLNASQIKLHQEGDILLEELKSKVPDIFSLPLLEQVNLLWGMVAELS